MEKNDTLRNLLIAAAVFFGIMSLGRVLLGPPATPVPNENAATLIPRESGTAATQPVQETGQLPPPPPGSAPPPQASPYSAVEAEEALTVPLGAGVVESAEFNPGDEPYRMRLELSNIGASIADAFLTDHAEALPGHGRYQLLSPVEHEDGRTWRSLAVERLNIDGVDVDLGNKRWHAQPPQPFSEQMPDGETLEGEKAEFWIDIVSESGPVARVRREFRLPRQTRKSLRRDLYVNATVENLSGKPHDFQIVEIGGVGVRKTDPRRDDRFVDVGIEMGDGTISGKRVQDASVVRQESRQLPLYSPDPAVNTRLSWVASDNQYFTLTVAPVTPGTSKPSDRIAASSAIDLDGDKETTDDVTFRLAVAPQRVEPGSTFTFASEVYIGGKQPRGFRDVPRYNARDYYFQISQGFGWCTFNWLVELMIWLLDGLHFAVRDYGLAIIILVLIVRTLLHPITKKGQVNMVRMQHRMQELAPKMEEIKKKYANDKARMQQEMMKLNINPAGQMLTCLPMFLQMPIWIALYLSLSNNIAMRHEPLHFTWIHDLTAPDALIRFSSPIHLPIFGAIDAFNLLPFLLGIAMYTNQKLMPQAKPSPNMTEQQRAQQDMMKKMGPMMSIMMCLVLYKAPSGLNLYIMASSIFGTIEQHLIRKHIREQEEAGTLHGPKKNEDKSNSKPKKLKFRWLQRLQDMADEARKEQLRRAGKRPK
ncbi:MAG: membrane protein insertase YidC [Phycisphaerae bacterium]|nr:membrane protein insertase YidC [Phycisphaerae bacterium]